MRQSVTQWRRPLLLAATLATVLLAAQVAVAAPRVQQLHPIGAGSLDQLTGDAFDQAFLAQMTMHHAMGVLMTQPVVKSGAHQELKDLGARMIADQTQEIEQMRGWMQAWYGLDVSCPMVSGEAGVHPGAGSIGPGGMMPSAGMPMMPAGMPMMPGGMPGMLPGSRMGTMPMPGMPTAGMPMMGGLSSLPPDQLDSTFMAWMIEHHQGAIDMAMLADERSAHQEVKVLAASVITTQSAEIQTMQGWLAEWYGR